MFSKTVTGCLWKPCPSKLVLNIVCIYNFQHSSSLQKRSLNFMLQVKEELLHCAFFWKILHAEIVLAWIPLMKNTYVTIRNEIFNHCVRREQCLSKKGPLSDCSFLWKRSIRVIWLKIQSLVIPKKRTLRVIYAKVTSCRCELVAGFISDIGTYS